jgi:hypothetical protein
VSMVVAVCPLFPPATFVRPLGLPRLLRQFKPDGPTGFLLPPKDLTRNNRIKVI